MVVSELKFISVLGSLSISNFSSIDPPNLNRTFSRLSYTLIYRMSHNIFEILTIVGDFSTSRQGGFALGIPIPSVGIIEVRLNLSRDT